MSNNSSREILFYLFKLACLVLALQFGAYSGFGQSVDVDPSPSPASTPGDPDSSFDLRSFGAVGDGITDDGPALQEALNALAEAGGGTLVVPEGRYAILTPVEKDFNGLASAVTIRGIESETFVPPSDSPGEQLSLGLDLVSEFAPKTGEPGVAITISNLREFNIEHIGFIGTPNISTDALITLSLADIDQASIYHCEFYGLISQIIGGSVVQSLRTNLSINQTKFLGCSGKSGVWVPVLQNLTWKGLSITDTVFVDYGQRSELFSKTGFGAPYSWIAIANAAALTNDYPRREIVMRNVFLDEGGYFGVTVLPYMYQPASAPIDLFYVSKLHMNVSNFGTSGHHLFDIKRVMIERSTFGWSHNADSSIHLQTVDNAILDQVESTDAANRIRADLNSGRLTIVNSIYGDIASEAETTKIVNTIAPQVDPVQSVRQRFLEMLGREPEPSEHFYWSDRLLRCDEDPQCLIDRQADLSDLLSAGPATTFAVTGRITDESEVPIANAVVTLSGVQSVTTQTDENGRYSFSGIPTSGEYKISPRRVGFTFLHSERTITTPHGDQVADFSGLSNRLYVRSHYIDFLNREPDESGLLFWTDQINECQQTGATCDPNARGINVSAAFFLSTEFQETGYLVYRMYKVAYGDMPGTPVPLRLNEFLPDTRQIGRDVIVGQGDWEARLAANKAQFLADFVTRQRFRTTYPTTLSPQQFVDALYANAEVVPTASSLADAISEFGSAVDTADSAARARALLRVSEDPSLATKEYNRAFVLMQYFGYLRRDPDNQDSSDFSGFDFWLNKLEEFHGNFVNAEMVKAFISSGEYIERFQIEPEQ